MVARSATFPARHRAAPGEHAVALFLVVFRLFAVTSVATDVVATATSRRPMVTGLVAHVTNASAGRFAKTGRRFGVDQIAGTGLDGKAATPAPSSDHDVIVVDIQCIGCWWAIIFIDVGLVVLTVSDCPLISSLLRFGFKKVQCVLKMCFNVLLKLLSFLLIAPNNKFVLMY